jgi:capsular exopolysaccharide synthesis family protein
MATSSQNNNALLSTQDLEQILRIFKKNWWILLVFPFLFGAASYIYTYRLPEIHGARSKVLVEDEETYDYQREIRRQVGYYGKYEKIQNQMRVIQSRDLVKKAIDKLDFSVSYHIVGRFRTEEYVGGMPYEVEVHPEKGRIYGKRIYLDILDRERYRINYEFEEKAHSFTFRFGERVSTPHFSMTVTAKPKMQEGNIERFKNSNYFFVRHRESHLVSRFLSRLQVKNLEFTSILQLSVQDAVPQRAVSFLDTLAHVYIDHTLEQRKEVNRNTMRYIEKQLEKVTGILNGIEDTLEQYKSQRGILDLGKEETEYFERLVKFDEQKRRMELRLESYNSLENYVRKLNTKDERLLPSSFYVSEDDEFLKKAVNELYELQSQRNQSLYGSTEVSPKVEQIENDIDRMKGNLLTYIENSKEAVKDRIQELNDQIARYEGVIKGIPEKERGLLNIQRRRKVNEELYMYLLEKRANTVIARAGIVPETKVIESARKVGVVRPSEGRYVLLSGGAGFVFALLLVFVRTLFFYRIASLQELKGLTVLPVLGQLFRDREAMKEDQLHFIEGGRGMHVESLRTIRTNLQYFLPDGQDNVIQVNSVGPGEGKTFVSANLAHILALAEKKVLLIEFDLHKPRLHKAFGMEQRDGVSSYLAGRGTQEDVIRSTGYDHLDIALCGEVPPNASELLLKEEVDDLVQYGRDHYDYVALDTPPAGVISDAIGLMPKADLNLFILNTRSSRKQELRFIEGLVEKHELHSVGLVLNGVRERRLSYYYDRYGYMYGYGRGYGYYGKN